MAKLVDPDSLSRYVEIDFGTSGSAATGEKGITLRVSGNLDDTSPGKTSGVTGQAIYSKCKELWKTESDLNKLKFPLKAITEVKFDLYQGWVWFDSQSKDLVRDAGWAYRSGSDNTLIETYMGIVTLGSFYTGSAQAYIQQFTENNSKTGPTASIDKQGEVDEPIWIFSNGFFDYTNFFKIFLREQGQTFVESDLVTEQDLSALTYNVYKVPLANVADPKIAVSDATITTTSPYDQMIVDYLSGSIYETYVPPDIDVAKTYYPFNVVYSGSRWYRMTGSADVSGGNPNPSSSLEWESYPGERQVGSNYYAYNRIVSASGGTVEQVYAWMQYQLRQESDINGDKIGDAWGYATGSTANLLAAFVGDNLNTKQGVFVDYIDSNDINDITLYDITVDTSGSTTTARTYPFVSAGTIVFNTTLIGDTSSSFKMYFLNDDAGDDLGYDYDTVNAIVVSQSNGTDPITGSVFDGDMIASTTFTFDYDFNVQRGSDSSASTAPVVVAALGLSSAEWVFGTFSITRATGLNFPVNAPEERNYYNP